MQLPVQITAHNLALAPADEQAIRSAAAKLDRFASRILSCRVAIEAEGGGHSGRQYRIHVKLDVPGDEIVVRRRSDEAILVAVHQAFKAVGRRLQDHVRHQRGQVKLPAGRRKSR